MFEYHWTGLYDRCGRKIHEGDILQVNWQDARYPVHDIGPVVWNEDDACWVLGEGGSPKYDAKHHMTVVGSIYDSSYVYSRRLHPEISMGRKADD